MFCTSKMYSMYMYSKKYLAAFLNYGKRKSGSIEKCVSMMAETS